MYTISKRLEIAGAHNLELPYQSPCCNVHGHNWIVTVHCRSKKLTGYGMIVDFKRVKDEVVSHLDHKYFNDVLSFNPTAENLAKWICDTVDGLCEVGECYKVEVQESEGNIATYAKEGEDR